MLYLCDFVSIVVVGFDSVNYRTELGHEDG